MAGDGEGAMSRDGMTPQREEALLAAMLRYQVGVDPNVVGPVLDLAAVGLVNDAWRNSPVENWHAGHGPLDDGAMLRVNAHTTWRVRELVRRWRAEVGVAPDADVDALDELDLDEVDWLAVRIFRWLTHPTRRLPIGATLSDVAGASLDEFVDHVDGVLGAFAASAEARGIRHAVWRAAAHGGLACRHWWGTPTWPALVDRFVTALDGPSDPHWGPDGAWRARLPAAPAQVADRILLRRTLLQQPWALKADAATWLVGAGIGSLRDRLPALPDDLELPE